MLGVPTRLLRPLVDFRLVNHLPLRLKQSLPPLVLMKRFAREERFSRLWSVRPGLLVTLILQSLESPSPLLAVLHYQILRMRLKLPVDFSELEDMLPVSPSIDRFESLISFFETYPVTPSRRFISNRIDYFSGSY